MTLDSVLGPAGFGAAQPLPVPDPATAPILMALRDCLCREIATTVLGPACRCYVAWGQSLPIQDGCSCMCGDDAQHNGDAWVKLESLEPDLDAGGGITQGWCPAGWVATITMGIYRCIPIAEADDVLPSESITDTSLALLSDMAALWRVLTCCTEAVGDGLRVTAWTPIDPTTNCAGGSLMFQVPLAGTTACP